MRTLAIRFHRSPANETVGTISLGSLLAQWPQAMAAIPELPHPAVTSLRPGDIVSCLRLNLWDAQREQLVSFRGTGELAHARCAPALMGFGAAGTIWGCGVRNIAGWVVSGLNDLIEP